MMEKGRISALQMAIMMYPAILATAILLVPSITFQFAERDMWLSPVWASLTGLLTVYTAVQLNKFYPQENIVQYGEHILGVIPGKALGLTYLLFYLHITGVMFREYAEFLLGNFLPKTPMIVIIVSLAVVCAYAVHGGVEVLARAAQMFVPIIMLLLALVFILIIPELKVKNMFPVLEHGIMPSIMGSFTPQAWFSEFLLISFLLPFLKDRENGRKWGMISVMVVMLTLVVANFISLLLFGGITASITYPVMSLAKLISIADFLTHLESIIMAIWVAGTFLKISVFYYVLVLGTALWLKLSDYRPMVFPLGLLLVVVSIWSAPNLQELAHYLSTTAFFELVLLQTVIPTLLLLLAVIRCSFRKSTGRREQQKG